MFGAPRKTAGSRRPITGGIRPGLFYPIVAGLLLTNALAAVAVLMSPDIAALLNGQNQRVIDAYEDRIAQLRVEVDRVHSRQYAEAGDINLQLQDIAQQQEVLLEQHQLIAQLAKKAEDLGITTASLPADGSADDGAAATKTTALPAPVADATSPAGVANAAADVASLSARIDGMQTDSRLALAALSESATKSADEIIETLRPLGIQATVPETGDAEGGPYLPPVDGPDAVSLVDDANDTNLALARLAAARNAFDDAPVHMPLTGPVRISSGFGNRTDPFTRGRAFHPGIDFPAPIGTPVLSAGSGKVTFVGQINGYGNVVEVTSADGLMVLYGHLSAFIARQGDTVDTGTPIARVGSTGRSTGPHLHFEIRRDDKAVDPQAYLSAGRKLDALLGIDT